MLRVRLIGGIGLELDGTELQAPRLRRSRRLLAWLALRRGLHARGTVAAALWPDVLDASARASLRSALTELRAELGPAAECLLSSRDSVGLDDERVSVDACEFAALLAQGRPDQAVQLGAGELLTGLDEEWVLAAREEHERAVADALERLAAAAEQDGDLSAAVRHTRAALALDPLAEEVGRRLIERLARAGERAAALAAYESLAARMRTTLGIMPSAGTRALVAELRSAEVGSVPPPAALSREHDSSFVGRRRELEHLRSAWAGTRLHVGRRLVLLAGEPGIGKTRIAMQFAREAAGRDAVVLAGRCWEEPLAAYDPFLEALRQAHDALGPDALEALAGPTQGELTRLLGGAPGEVPAGEGAGARHRLFDAVDAVLSGLAARGSLVLVLDDLHWADRPTLLLLAFVLRSGRRAPLLAIGTYRDTELGRRSPLLAALADLQRDRMLGRIAVRGLPPGELEQLAREWLGGSANAALAGRIHERTAGNAFFAEELLRGLAEHREGSVPESIRHAVGARLSRLSDAANELLAVAAVTHGEADAAVLAGSSELAPAVAESALDELLAEQLLRPAAAAPQAFEFPHALVREVVFDELNALRRSRLHRRVAAQLIDRDAERHVEEVAQHLFESADAGEQQRTVEYLLRAGDRSMAMLAYEAAADYYDKSLQVAGPSGEALVRRGDALLRAGERERARACYREAAELARAGGDPRLLARAALGFAGLAVTIVDVDGAAVELLEQALAALGGSEPALRSRLLARLAVELYYAAPRERSEAHSAEAVAVARGVEDPRALVAALGARHVALWRPDALPERLAIADEMTAAAHAAGDGQLELEGRNWRVVDLFELGDLARWREEVARFAELAESQRLPGYAWYVPLWRAVDAELQGSFTEAAELREQARELGTRAGDRNAELFAAMLEYGEHVLRGSYEQLDFSYAKEKIEHPGSGAAWISGYAWMLAAVGRRDEAQTQLARIAADRFALLPFDTNWLSAIGEAADTAILLGDRKTAAVVYELLRPYAGRPLTSGRAVGSYGAADRHLGGLAALLGRDALATSHYEAALRGNAGTRVWLVRTQLAFAEHLQRVGEHARASALSRAGAAAAAELGLRAAARLG